MKWVSCISEREETPAALDEVIERVRAGLGGDEPTVLLVFASSEHMTSFADLPGDVLKALPAKALVGCSGGGIIGGGIEAEQRPALAVLAGVLPDVTVDARRIATSQLPKTADAERWHELLAVHPDEDPHFVVLADPLSNAKHDWLRGLDRAYPNATKVGGLVSGSQMAEGLALFTNDDAEHQGVSILSVRGNVRLDPIIAQGCKPISEPMLITSCEGNRIYGIDQKKPGEVLRSIYETLHDDDRELFGSSLFVGLQTRDQVEYAHGDFLIRNIVGMLKDGDAIAVAADFERWQVMRFHLRDRYASAADLAVQLTHYVEGLATVRPQGALLFSCLGRGEHLYGQPNHDSDLFRQKLGDVALGGFFCNGEIGPVAGHTYTHAYTSAFGVFCPKQPA